MQASFPMYARPELEGGYQRFWERVRHRLILAGLDAPEHLTMDGIGTDFWLRSDLVLSQTCSLPFRTKLHPNARLVGAFDHRLPGCPAGHYRSAIIARKRDPRREITAFEGATLAFNEPGSQSGYAALAAHLETGPPVTFASCVQTGAHRASAMAVAAGEADIAAVDAVSWAFMERFDPFARDLHAIGWTEPTPALPLICALGIDVSAIRAAVRGAVQDLDETQKDELMIYDFVETPLDAVLSVKTPGKGLLDMALRSAHLGELFRQKSHED